MRVLSPEPLLGADPGQVAAILANARQVDDVGDAERCQAFAVAYAGELQQMRALHRAGRDDHLLAGAREAALGRP